MRLCYVGHLVTLFLFGSKSTGIIITDIFKISPHRILFTFLQELNSLSPPPPPQSTLLDFSISHLYVRFNIAYFPFRINLIVMKNCNIANRAVQSNSAWLALIVYAYKVRNRGGRGGGYSIYPWVEMCDPVLQTLTLFKTKLVRLMIPRLKNLTLKHTLFKTYAKTTYPETN